jgi:hypothetical protein
MQHAKSHGREIRDPAMLYLQHDKLHALKVGMLVQLSRQVVTVLEEGLISVLGIAFLGETTIVILLVLLIVTSSSTIIASKFVKGFNQGASRI